MFFPTFGIEAEIYGGPTTHTHTHTHAPGLRDLPRLLRGEVRSGTGHPIHVRACARTREPMSEFCQAPCWVLGWSTL